jgi:tetratricopeptide (TPR) repeat protein
MKIYPSQIFFTVSVGLLFSSIAIAQSQSSVSPQQLKPTNTNSIQQDKVLDDKIYRFTREEVDRFKRDIKEPTELFIRNKVNETMLGYTSLFAVIFGSTAGFVLANRWKVEFKKQYLEIIKEEVTEKIKVGVEKEFQGLKNDLSIQRRKDEIIQELSILVPRPDLFFQEQVKPGAKPMLKKLTTELEDLKNSNPNLYLTIEDYIRWGDGIYYSAWEGLPEAYNTWFNQDNKPKNFKDVEAFECYEKAILRYEEAIELQPHAYYAYLGKGNALRMSGRYDKQRYDRAIECYEKATQDENISFIAYVNMGLASRRSINGKEGLIKGLECLDKALAIFPSYARTYYNKACYHSQLNDFDQAIINLEKSIKLAPEKSTEGAERDDDFCPMSKHERFQELVPNYSVKCPMSRSEEN